MYTGSLKQVMNESMTQKMAYTISKPLNFLTKPAVIVKRKYDTASKKEKDEMRRMIVGNIAGHGIGLFAGGVPGAIVGSGLGTGAGYLYNKLKNSR